MSVLFLTDAVVRRAKHSDPRKQCFLWDEAVPGFGVRVYASGRKTFVFRFYAGPKRTIDSVGPVGVLTVEQARSIARERLRRVVLQEHDVVPERTFSEFAADYLENYAKKYKRSWMLDFYYLESHVLPDLGHLQIKAITRRHIEKLHTKMSGKPFAANRAVALISTMFTKAIEWGEAEENPARAIRKHDEKSRDVFITKEQYPKLKAAIDAEPLLQVRAALYLLFLTGLRKSEVLGIRWEDIDFEQKLLRIPDTKNGEPHHIPLTVEACRVLQSVPKTGRHVFMWRGKQMLDFRKSWDNIRRRAGMPHLRVHDIRRTVGSWLAQEGHSLHLIGEVLNHKDPRSTRVYARFQKEHIRQALETFGKVSETNVR